MSKILITLLGLLAASGTWATNSFTTHYNFALPQDGDTNWGSGYRANFTALDADLYSTASTLTSHINATSSAHPGTAISVVHGPNVCLVAVTAQAYLDCLDSAINTIIGGGAASLSGSNIFTGNNTFTGALIASGSVTLSSFGLGIVHSSSGGALSSSSLSLTSDVSGILPKANGGSAQDNSALSFPASGTLATLAGSETLTNKTLSGNIATNLVSGAATITLPTSTGTLATLAGSETLTNKTLSGNIATNLVSGAATITLPTSTGTLATLAGSETLSNKTLTAPVLNSFVSNGVTFTMPTADGSSGQFIKTNASGVLSFGSALVNPMTTAGDIIVGGSSGTPTRLAIGTAGKGLLSDGTNLSYSYPVIQTKVANYTAVLGDDVVLASGSAFTVTLPTAVGSSGKTYRIKKTDTSATNTITIATTSAQTIDGRASSDIVLRQYGDFIAVVSDGANWSIISKKETQYVSASMTALLLSTIGSGNFGNVTGNSVSLTFGQWRVCGYFALGLTATSAATTVATSSGFFAANGANSASTPTALTGTVGPITWSGTNSIVIGASNIGAASEPQIQSSTQCFTFNTSTTQSVFLVPNTSFSTAGSAAVGGAIWAERLW